MTPTFLVYVVLLVFTLWGGWKLTKQIHEKRKRTFWRSGVLAVVVAPGFFGAGHGGQVLPALLSAVLTVRHGDWAGSPLLVLLVFIPFAIGPMLATWLVILIVWRWRDWFEQE